MPVLSLVEGAAMTFKLPPQFGQCSMSMSKTPLSSLAQLRRAGAPCGSAVHALCKRFHGWRASW
jgi:hypothetical protein